jgi:lipoyl(octanoyl) transferase
MLDRSLNATVDPGASRLRSMPRADALPAGWAVSSGLVAYPQAEAVMEARANAIAEGAAGELVWLLEHPPLYTAGVSAKPADLLDPQRFPVFRSGRGGQFTYHGPGQRVAYVMLDLTARGRDVRAFVQSLQAWIIEALALLGVRGGVREGRVGVWVERVAPGGQAREDKVAAIGVKLRRWVSFHGVSLNVDPDLGHFGGIVPCGVTAHGVTSLADLGATASLGDADAALKEAFVAIFGPVADAPPPL